MNRIVAHVSVLLIICIYSSSLSAKVNLPNIFSDHMVLQRHQKNPVWGTASKGESITVSISTQMHYIKADKEGKWKVYLNPMEAGGPYELKVIGQNEIIIKDVLIGEVWVCSGQSNMGFALNGAYHNEIEVASANYPEIRLLRVPVGGSTELKSDMDANWKVCSPETVGGFSATGYLFGRRLHNTLGVPIGLINNAWGGSAIEAWIPRDTLDEFKEYTSFLEDWDKHVKAYSDEDFNAEMNEYKEWEKSGKPGGHRYPPEDMRTGRKRPGNIYNFMVNPILGYGIKGTIWCQGESNVGRAYQYRSFFPLLINTLRNKWNQGDFPFYWVQLADFNSEDSIPKGSMWAELREAQTMTLSLPNTGECVIFDTGEGRDIHPRDKQTVANRLIRHALAKDYGYDFQSESPRYESMEISGNKVILTFNNVEKGLYAFDIKEVKGFTIAGEDQKFVWATAKIVGKNKIEVYAEEIDNPKAVRYGWANNPVINLYDKNGLPVTPFRTDDWPGVTAKRVLNYW